MESLELPNISFVSHSFADDVGKVFFYNNRVFRTVNSHYAELYVELLKKTWIDEIFRAGLVPTWICNEISIPNVALILEHERLSFDGHPGEWTAHMDWLAAKTMIKMNIKLAHHGYLVKDSHSWNLSFCKGIPIFIDFGSIIQSQNIPNGWLREFIKYFGTSIWVASRMITASLQLSQYLRQEGSQGFGHEIFNNKYLNNIIFYELRKLEKMKESPLHFFKAIDQWLDKHQPQKNTKMSAVNRNTNSVDRNHYRVEKEKIVREILTHVQPETILDLGSGQGLYSELSASLGASVVALDHNEAAINACRLRAEQKNLDITPVLMKFQYPTPNYGTGLAKADAFTRYKVDIVLVLDFIQYICIEQQMSVEMFCRCCIKYANKGLILEYIDPSDESILQFNPSIPKEYTLENIFNLVSSKFPNYDLWEYQTNRIKRSFLFFSV